MDRKILILLSLSLLVISSGCTSKDSSSEERTNITQTEAKEVVKSAGTYRNVTGMADRSSNLMVKEYNLSEISRVKKGNISSDYDVIDEDVFFRIDEFEEKPSYVVILYSGYEKKRIYQVDHRGAILADVSHDRVEDKRREISKELGICRESMSAYLDDMTSSFAATDEKLMMVAQNHGSEEIIMKSVKLERDNGGKSVTRNVSKAVDPGETVEITFDQLSAADGCNVYNVILTYHQGGLRGMVARASIEGHLD